MGALMDIHSAIFDVWSLVRGGTLGKEIAYREYQHDVFTVRELLEETEDAKGVHDLLAEAWGATLATETMIQCFQEARRLGWTSKVRCQYCGDPVYGESTLAGTDRRVHVKCHVNREARDPYAGQGLGA